VEHAHSWAQYVIYAPYIQRIINYKTDMEFVYDGKHGAYQPHIVWAPTVHPPSPPTAAAAGTSAATQDSLPARSHAPPTLRHAPPTLRHAPLATPESSRAVTRRGKKQNILVKGLKTPFLCAAQTTLLTTSLTSI
jgi:hypothetical protein